MALLKGPDPDFPYLDENERYRFPRPGKTNESIIAVGGNLSPGMLLSAYEQGIFPWYNPEDPVLWQSPDPRFVIFPGKLHVSKSMRKVLKSNEYEIILNKNFEAVIRGCSEVDRPGQGGTWITEDIIGAYLALHRLGYAVCAESWKDGELAGGCYGVLLGRVFCGESMFAKQPNASKAAFITLAEKLFFSGLAFIDCQVPTRHLRSLGGEEVPRAEFLRLLAEALKTP
ncbi:MAG: leucyl/phenylalanyl-tRNA--protein transferase [Treponema sp.]|jgi:leucyl/phenylalanyl-tRNA--protein transferase|nr:leucyl/phenylalanyl-tRNA--protein transferase [Treponema sp.]